VYVLIRTDILLADQIVQVGHACLDAGSSFHQPDQKSNLVLLSVANEKHLLDSVDRIEAAGIRCVVFHEPDDEMGYTAACTEPVAGIQRRRFQKFQLWRSEDAIGDARPPPLPAFFRPFAGSARMSWPSA